MKLSGNRLQQKTATQNSTLRTKSKLCSKVLKYRTVVFAYPTSTPSFPVPHIPLSVPYLLEGLIKPRRPKMATRPKPDQSEYRNYPGHRNWAKDGHVTYAGPMKTILVSRGPEETNSSRLANENTESCSHKIW